MLTTDSKKYGEKCIEVLKILGKKEEVESQGSEVVGLKNKGGDVRIIGKNYHRKA